MLSAMILLKMICLFSDKLKDICGRTKKGMEQFLQKLLHPY